MEIKTSEGDSKKGQGILVFIGYIFTFLGILLGISFIFQLANIFPFLYQSYSIIRLVIICLGFFVLLISSIDLRKYEEDEKYKELLFKFGIILILYGLFFSIFYSGYFGILLPMAFLILIGWVFINSVKKIQFPDQRINYVYRILIMIIIIQILISIFFLIIY